MLHSTVGPSSPLPQGCTEPPCECSPLGHYTAPPHSWAHGMALHPLHWALCPPVALHAPTAVHCTLPRLHCTWPQTLPAPAVALHPPVTALHSPTDNCIACGTTLYPPMAPYCTTAPHCTLPWHRHCAALHILHNRDITPLQRCRALPHTTTPHPLWHTLCIPHSAPWPCTPVALHCMLPIAVHCMLPVMLHRTPPLALPCPALPWTLPVALRSALAALQRPARPPAPHRTAHPRPARRAAVTRGPTCGPQTPRAPPAAHVASTCPRAPTRGRPQPITGVPAAAPISPRQGGPPLCAHAPAEGGGASHGLWRRAPPPPARRRHVLYVRREALTLYVAAACV